MTSLVPTYYSDTNIFDVPIDFFKKIDVNCIFFDLDNTLDSFKCEVGSKKTTEYINKLKLEGYKIYIISNNSESRVKKYANSLNIEYLYKSGKPFTKKIEKFIKDNKLIKENCIIIGDQLLTDIKCANRLKIKSLLVEDLVKENQLVTKFNKFFDKIIRRRLKKKNKLNDWRVVYGRIQ